MLEIKKAICLLLIGGSVILGQSKGSENKKCWIEFDEPPTSETSLCTILSCIVGAITYNFQLGYKIIHKNNIPKDYTYIEEKWCIDKTQEPDHILSSWASRQRSSVKNKFIEEEKTCNSNN